ncbi:MAG: hypothetical protein GTO02_07570, partial [Candidatus Dadabacteria bacterium]|nr:hypothetical protein [Candidatus Dadabacteria bacterium]NIQ14254.1 hypothetical protein [Candidatus Dadabacteria bacterium]
ESLGRNCISIIFSLGDATLFFWKALISTITPPYNYKLVAEQMYDIGFKSISIVIVSAMAIGMVMVVQMAWGFAWFGAKGLVGPVVTLSFV